MRQKDELIDETKKKNGVMKLLRFIGIAAMILGKNPISSYLRLFVASISVSALTCWQIN